MADEDDLSDLMGPEPEAAPLPVLTPGREAFRRSRSLSLKPRKLSNERMLRVLTAISDMPVAADACMRAGMSVTTLKYWLTKSNDGAPGDGYDVIFDPEEPEATRRFHEAWNDAMEMGLGRVESATTQRALGYLEPLTFQGRVTYKHDPDLVALFGYECQQTYMLDAMTGAPVPETVFKQDPDLMMFILKTRKADIYGNKQQIDVNHRGGVLVVAKVASTPQALVDMSKDFKAEAIDVEFSEVTDPTQ